MWSAVKPPERAVLTARQWGQPPGGHGRRVGLSAESQGRKPGYSALCRPWSADGEMEMFSLTCFSSRIDGLPFYLLSALLLMEM